MRECTITWTDDDVRSAEDSMDLNEPLTEDEIDILLRDMQDDHDSSVGINWEVIEQWIHIIIRRRNKITELTKDQFVNLVELYSEEVIEDMDFATLRQCAKEGIAEKAGESFETTSKISMARAFYAPPHPF